MRKQKQILRVLVTYYRKKTKSLVYHAANDKIKSDTMLSAINFVEIEGFIRCELKKRIFEFCYFVNMICYNNVMNYFQAWHNPSSPLLCKSFNEQLIDLLKLTWPLSHAMTMMSSCATDYYSPLQCDIPVIIKKNYLILNRFLSICRLSNFKFLSTWAFVEGIFQITRGIPKVGNKGNVLRRYSLLYTILLWIKK